MIDKKDSEQIINGIEKISLLRNLCKASFNTHVEGAFPSKSDRDTLAREVLGITDNDTLQEITVKQLILFFTLNKFAPATEEVGNKYQQKESKSPDRVWAKIALNARKKYNAVGNPIGTRYLKVNHINLFALDRLKDFTFTHGSLIGLYKYRDGTQLKVLGSTKKECIRAMEVILTAVYPEQRNGSIKGNVYWGEAPESQEPPDLQGITSDIVHLDFYQGGIGKLFTLKPDNF